MGHSVLRKSTNTARIKENIDIFDRSILDDLLSIINEFEQVRVIPREQLVWYTSPGYKAGAWTQR
ncbi:aldo/keto reductase family oxidoreductase, putative [Medicago truncatula]|uniref:Aldo/keto reductase family oxidoreductase, putative n=1 Tax=Medicago truncatula TaxID=3880 RepID=A0A072UIW5_MEDTR|nr:aldo/keto reductase family oxidoreductase, putative [Medicago truncatula]